MIERYTRKEMGRLWEPQNRFQKWLDVEIAACEAWADLGKIPKSALAVIKKKADFDVGRIDEIEAVVKHDVIAFLTSVAETVGPESRYIHKGLTSSDIVDTAQCLLMREAAGIIIKDLRKLSGILREQAFRYKNTVCIGRSHGVHAEPMTFGDYYQWGCDPNLLKLGNCDPWRPVDPDPASNDTVRSTSPAPHTLLDEFGYFFRNQPLQLQAMIVVSHFSGYEMLTNLRILTKESDWTIWTEYLDGLSPAPRELTKTIAASWLALSLAWRRHRRRIAPDNAS